MTRLSRTGRWLAGALMALAMVGAFAQTPASAPQAQQAAAQSASQSDNANNPATHPAQPLAGIASENIFNVPRRDMAAEARGLGFFDRYRSNKG